MYSPFVCLAIGELDRALLENVPVHGILQQRPDDTFTELVSVSPRCSCRHAQSHSRRNKGVKIGPFSLHIRNKRTSLLATEEDEPSSIFSRKRTSLPPASSWTSTKCHNLPMRCEDRTTKFNGQLGKVKAASASHFHASAHSASVKIL